MQVKRDVKIPLHQQVKSALRRSIETGEWKRAQKIPSEPELCRAFGIARGTLRQAITDLVREGLLESRQGDGTYVASRKVEPELTGFYSFAREAQHDGLQPTSRILLWARTLADEKLAGRLCLEPGSEILLVTRLRLLANEPVLIETCCLPAALADYLQKEDFTHGALYDAIEERCNLRIMRAEETFEAVVLGEREAQLLGVRLGAPGFSVERITYAANDRPIEVRFGTIRGDRCRYFVELR